MASQDGEADEAEASQNDESEKFGTSQDGSSDDLAEETQLEQAEADGELLEEDDSSDAGAEEESLLGDASDLDEEIDKSRYDEEDTVLLPIAQAPEGFKVGDRLTVFVYRDSSDRVIATVNRPYLVVGEVAELSVKDMSEIGAFLDIGLERDLFLPFRETTYDIDIGEQVLAAMYVDRTGRLAGTMKIYPYLRTDSPYSEGDTVDAFIYEINGKFGAYAAVDGKYGGLIPAKEVVKDLKCGDRVEARVMNVREDGKLDLSLRKKAYLQMNDDCALILRKLAESQGKLPFTDKDSPERIKAECGMSKNQFKRAVGRLLKKGLIEIRPYSIVLTQAGDKDGVLGSGSIWKDEPSDGNVRPTRWGNIKPKSEREDNKDTDLESRDLKKGPRGSFEDRDRGSRGGFGSRDRDGGFGRRDRDSRGSFGREDRGSRGGFGGRDRGSRGGFGRDRSESRFGSRERFREKDVEERFGGRDTHARFTAEDSRPRLGERDLRGRFSEKESRFGFRERDSRSGFGERKSRSDFGDRDREREFRPRFGDRDRDSRPRFGDRDRDSRSRFGDRDRDSRPRFGDRERDSRPRFGDRESRSRFGDRDSRSRFGDRDSHSRFGERDRGDSRRGGRFRDSDSRDFQNPRDYGSSRGSRPNFGDRGMGGSRRERRGGDEE
ncbi:MAG: S1 RNA-binding domain-containing protein [Lachnospiraceae bacterium]|nr:S1 RNA-binding domain-containing protein [Lachnospiraceae bacterium]